MRTVKTLPQFDAWLDGLKDGLTAMRLRKRLRKVMLGGGDKSTQQLDIAAAIALSRTI